MFNALRTKGLSN